MGMGGPVGFNHAVLFARMDRMGLSPDDYDQLEADFLVMENAAIIEMQRKRD